MSKVYTVIIPIDRSVVYKVSDRPFPWLCGFRKSKKDEEVFMLDLLNASHEVQSVEVDTNEVIVKLVTIDTAYGNLLQAMIEENAVDFCLHEMRYNDRPKPLSFIVSIYPSVKK